jgi:magnesium transporter
VGGVDVRHITPDGVTRCRPDDIETLLDGPGLVWIDVRYWDLAAAQYLGKRLGLRERTVHDCAVRNHVPKLQVHADHAFVVLHAPERGERGHVHHIEVDQLVGRNWLLTVHGPMNDAVTLEAAYVETSAIARKLDSGRLRPATSHDLSAALVTVLIGRLVDYLTTLTEEVWDLEKQVTAGYVGDPEKFLEELFGVRHGLLAIRTMAALSGEVYGRMVQMTVFGDGGTAQLVDLEDRFHRVTAMADGQREYLEGVIEFYQARTNTKIAIAAERLAVIAAVTLPITALSSVLGMNVIVNDSTQVGQLVWILAVMLVMSAISLEWARRKGWW